MDLFESERSAAAPAPLADRMRPAALAEVVGQEHLLGAGKVLRRALEAGELHSMILWGPPGSGKTTLARLMARVAGAGFVAFSAVLSGVKEIRAVLTDAETARARRGARTILFVDEIHRFNRAQQDAFLPHVEMGTIILVGATTENPSFEVNSALLSRCRVYVLHALGEAELLALLRRALADSERGLAGLGPAVSDEALGLIAGLANGDARAALNVLELAVVLSTADAGGRRVVTETTVREAAQQRALLYDKSGEAHYNVISALHKSLRDSDPDAALYLAVAPKSNAVYTAFGEAQQDVRERPAEPVPLHIRNAPTRLMQDLGYGRGYQYAHDAPDARVEQEHLPEALRGRHYYRPSDRGAEADIGRRLADWRRWRAARAR